MNTKVKYYKNARTILTITFIIYFLAVVFIDAGVLHANIIDKVPLAGAIAIFMFGIAALDRIVKNMTTTEH